MRKFKIALIAVLIATLAQLGFGPSTTAHACTPVPPPPGVPPTGC